MHESVILIFSDHISHDLDLNSILFGWYKTFFVNFNEIDIWFLES